MQTFICRATPTTSCCTCTVLLGAHRDILIKGAYNSVNSKILMLKIMYRWIKCNSSLVAFQIAAHKVINLKLLVSSITLAAEDSRNAMVPMSNGIYVWILLLYCENTESHAPSPTLRA